VPTPAASRFSSSSPVEEAAPAVVVRVAPAVVPAPQAVVSAPREVVPAPQEVEQSPLADTPASQPEVPAPQPEVEEAEPAEDEWDDEEPEDSTAPFVDEALRRSESYTPVPPPPWRPPQFGPPEEPAPRKRLMPVIVGTMGVVLALGLVVAVAFSLSRPSTPATPDVALKVSKVLDFDPTGDGGDGAENEKTAKLAIDGKVDTVWRTEKYRSAALGGLKPGVGLVLDLGTERTVTGVRLSLSGKPSEVALLVPEKAANAAPMKSVKQWQSLAGSADAAGSVTLSPQQPVQARFVLVYLSGLPDVGDGYFRGGIAEATVLGR
jgi:hypothetical protein